MLRFHRLLFTFIIALSLTLLCGVAFADPAPSPEPDKPVPEQHQELAAPLFCAVSYVVLAEALIMDPGTSSQMKMEIGSRGHGLLSWIEAYWKGIGGDVEDLDPVFTTMLVDTRNMAHANWHMWLALVRQAGCKDMTNQYVNQSPF